MWPEGEAFSASGLRLPKSALELVGKLPGPGAKVIRVAAFSTRPCRPAPACTRSPDSSAPSYPSLPLAARAVEFSSIGCKLIERNCPWLCKPLI